MYKALSPDCIGHSVPFVDSAAVAARYGFKGVWFEIGRDSQAGVTLTKELLEKYQLHPAGFGLPLEFRKDQATYEKGIDQLENLAKFAQAVGMDRCATWIMPFSDTLPYRDNFDFHLKRLSLPARILREYGIHLGLEFVGPPAMRKGKKYEFIHNLEQVLDLCQAIGLDNMGLLLDIWHWDLAGHTAADFGKISDEKSIVLVHIMDAPAGIAPEDQADNVRCLPGATGVLRINEFLTGLRKLQYSGPVVAEPFVKELGLLPFEQATDLLKQAIDSVWLD